jgi:hypothetical protein
MFLHHISNHILISVLLQHLVSEDLGAAKEFRNVLVGLGAAFNHDPAQGGDTVGDHLQVVLEGKVLARLADLVHLLHSSLKIGEVLHVVCDAGVLCLGGEEEELSLSIECLFNCFCLVSFVSPSVHAPAHVASDAHLCLNRAAQLCAQVQPGLELGVEEGIECLDRRRERLDGLDGCGAVPRGSGSRSGGDGSNGSINGTSIEAGRGRCYVLEAAGGSLEPTDEGG